MASKLPYVNQPGSMINILAKIQSAKTPDRFTYDFLETKLGFKGGTSKQFIPLAKKLGLINSDGSPTDLYKKFRNTESSGAAIASALRVGYQEAFDRNEYANNLNKDQFKGLVVEITGLESGSRVVQLICQTFQKLKTLANFEASLPSDPGDSDNDEQRHDHRADQDQGGEVLRLGLSYTINLVLPKTDDPAVFNAIFRSLRENLLRK